GLTSVEDASSGDVQSYFLDGIKYLEKITPAEYAGKLKAFTYPTELEPMLGLAEASPGLVYHDQPPFSFNLSYRTRIGNDLDGTDLGYRIHILYNIVANPDSYAMETFADPTTPTEFSWSLTGFPPVPAAKGFRPTVHISVDTLRIDEETLQSIEDILYGTETTDPWLPTIDEIRDLFETYGSLIIVDNGDGTWTAIDSANEYITMLDSTTFRIANADAEFIDATTYTISTTIPDP
ncbi:MAG: hypothetical protein ABWY25_01260, partial [Paenisporosarcina sp.]